MRHYLLFLFMAISGVLCGQILPGTLDVSGFPTVSQDFNGVVMEAGQDDGSEGFESSVDAGMISFRLDPFTNPITGFTTTSETNCTTNIYRYTVYMHTQGLPADVIVEAKTFFNSGNRFPSSIPYDGLPVKPLGPRDLAPENGGTYIQLPDDGSQAIKVMEFVGCRENIMIQFRVKASTLASAGNSNFNVFYTVVGSLN